MVCQPDRPGSPWRSDCSVTTSGTRSIAWFRRDLRVHDNPAWSAATTKADRVTALFVVDPALIENAGPFRRDLLWAHLGSLDAELRRQGGRLLVRHGKPAQVVCEVADQVGAQSVHVNRDVTPYGHRRDEEVRDRLSGSLISWWGNYVLPPGSILTNDGHTPRVFTAFAKRWFSNLPAAWAEAGSATLGDDASDGLTEPDGVPFQPAGERAAQQRLEEFEQRVDRYTTDRDLPFIDGTSLLSADLRFGVLSPRAVMAQVGTHTKGRADFVRQLAWRDWYAHLLWEVPTLATNALRPEYDTIVWENESSDIEAWKEGRTGVPIVDAGMRQLRTTGWMHNRVRMITASFLVKDLLVDWRIGERWFRHLLVDADLAQNAGNWQWVAGTGPDSAPYFRVFNPVLQGKKFDPEGQYVRNFVPELRAVESRWIHEPWRAPSMDLALARVTLGQSYPYPIVDHASARIRTLAAYGKAIRDGRSTPARQTA
jgi:deoxyribodipyrimidine photo-lyase